MAAKKKEDTQPANRVVLGHFGRVVSGKHEGKYGYVDTQGETYDSKGELDTVEFVTRDENHERLVVKASDVESAVAGLR